MTIKERFVLMVQTGLLALASSDKGSWYIVMFTVGNAAELSEYDLIKEYDRRRQEGSEALQNMALEYIEWQMRIDNSGRSQEQPHQAWFTAYQEPGT